MKLRICMLTFILTIGISNTTYAYPTAGITKQLGNSLRRELQYPSTVELIKVDIPNKVIMYTTTRVNVRKHANTESDIIKTLDIAEKVKVLYTKDGWSKTKQGWIKSCYLSKKKPKDKILVTQEERYWLYQLVEAEAGDESEECREWITSVVFNLMELEETPNNVIDMIFYKNTFSPTLDGRIYSVTPRPSTIHAVDYVLRNGICTDALYFEADYCNSWWHSQQTKIIQIDSTIFYK